MRKIVRAFCVSRLRMHDLCAPFARHQEASSSSSGAALVVLNTEFSGTLLRMLWRSTSLRVCADGGANRLYDLARDLVPDAIVGDLDSVRSEVRSFYEEEKGVLISRVGEQDHNDLDKAIGFVRREWDSRGRHISILGAFGGRFDQEMATFDAAFRWSVDWPDVAYRMYSDDNVAALLTPNVRHTLRFRPDLEGPSCGLIPIGRKCERVTTTGLKWNLDDDPLEFGKLISSSNQLKDTDDDDDDAAKEDRIVEVTTSDPLIWTASLRPNALASCHHQREH